jgi:D-alanine-D-alanine ligase
MRVAFLYNCSSEDPAHAADDDVPSRSPIVAALERLGHEVTPIACTLDLASLRRQLIRSGPDVAFNRVDSLGGSDAMMPVVTLLLEAMQLPYTGCRTPTLVATASKIAVKQRLAQDRLPTPRWLTNGLSISINLDNLQIDGDSKFIIKAVYEHASFGLNDASLVDDTDSNRIGELLHERWSETGRPHFAEQFVEGREFNLSLLAPGPQVLPPAEIDFADYPAGKPRIVGFNAKCNQQSFEYHHTHRRFELPPRDQPLIRRLKGLALECWRLFRLEGYGRVDFRCDAGGQPWILEINANPCLLPDSGFAVALKEAGIGYDDGIRRILDDALGRRPALSTAPPVPKSMFINCS